MSEQYMSLSAYTLAAEKVVSKAKKYYKKLKLTDDLVADIVRYMAIADESYDETKSNGHGRQSWRQQWAIYAIKKHLNRNIRKTVVYNDWIKVKDNSNEVDLSTVSQRLDFLINNSNLTKKEATVINYLREGLSAREVAKKIQRSIKCVYLLRYKAFIKMRRISR